MEANICDVNHLDADVLLPPRKRLLAGLKKQSPDGDSVAWLSLVATSAAAADSASASASASSSSSHSSSEFNSRLNNILSSHNSNLSPEELVEVSNSAATAAVKAAEVARAAAEEKAAIAAKAEAKLRRRSRMKVETLNAAFSSDVRTIHRLPSSLIFGAKSPKILTARPSMASGFTRRISIRCAVRFRPCIDIHKGKVKQIVGSTLSDSKDDGSVLVTNFVSDKSAAEYAKMYKEDGLTGGHVIMLGADPFSRAAAIEALHAYPGGLQVGGGINSENCLHYIEEGASHVIVTSYVFNNGQMDLERLKDLVLVVGKERLVLDLSCRKRDGKYAIVTDRWQKFSDVNLDEELLNFLANFADEFLIHGVDVEGKKLGIDEELVALLGKHSPIPVTYAGGVTVMADLERIKVAGLGHVDVTVGSALDVFGGNLSYKDVVAWHAQQEALTV